jgi:hypothetical protein
MISLSEYIICEAKAYGGEKYEHDVKAFTPELERAKKDWGEYKIKVNSKGEMYGHFENRLKLWPNKGTVKYTGQYELVSDAKKSTSTNKPKKKTKLEEYEKPANIPNVNLSKMPLVEGYVTKYGYNNLKDLLTSGHEDLEKYVILYSNIHVNSGVHASRYLTSMKIIDNGGCYWDNIKDARDYAKSNRLKNKSNRTKNGNGEDIKYSPMKLGYALLEAVYLRRTYDPSYK